ncbi:MAG: hypothetical protein ABIT04_10125 [Novosphingobium sp.]
MPMRSGTSLILSAAAIVQLAQAEPVAAQGPPPANDWTKIIVYYTRDEQGSSLKSVNINGITVDPRSDNTDIPDAKYLAKVRTKWNGRAYLSRDWRLWVLRGDFRRPIVDPFYTLTVTEQRQTGLATVNYVLERLQSDDPPHAATICKIRKAIQKSVPMKRVATGC